MGEVEEGNHVALRWKWENQDMCSCRNRVFLVDRHNERFSSDLFFCRNVGEAKENIESDLNRNLYPMWLLHLEKMLTTLFDSTVWSFSRCSIRSHSRIA